MAKRSTRSRTPDAIKLLRDDHTEVTALFGKYEKARNRMSEDQKEQLAQQICQMLTVHTRIEEEIFYPACQEQVKGAEDLLAEAKVEHQSAKDLIEQIEEGDAGSEEYDAQVRVLGEYVKHHVKEEQNELFPKVKKSKIDLKALGQQLAERKKRELCTYRIPVAYALATAFNENSGSHSSPRSSLTARVRPSELGSAPPT